MKTILKITTVLTVIFLTSCNSEPSLQQYFVDHQDDQGFIAVDIPSSILDKESISMTDEEKEALESIKKVNFLALKLGDDNVEKYEQEKVAIANILKNKKYETLMRFGRNGVNAQVKYQGDNDDIDEVIVFATDPTKGLALVRVLGDNMRPEKIAKLAKSVEKGNIDLSAFKKISEAFTD